MVGVWFRKLPGSQQLKPRIAGALIAVLLTGATGCRKSAEPARTEAQYSPAPSSAAAPGSPAPGSLADRLNAVQSGTADEAGKPALPNWKPASTTGPAIPLVKGLVVVTAVSLYTADFESIKTVKDISPTTVTVGYSADRPTPQMNGLLGGAEPGKADPKNLFPAKVRCTRLIDVPDLSNAHSYSEYFCENPLEHFPGSTSISGSTEVLNQLRANQQEEFHFATADKFAILTQLGAQIEGHKPDSPTLAMHSGQMMYSCTLHRVEPVDLSVPVLLNDQRVELPALHAMCALDDGEEAHLYYLDQPANPIVLAFQLGPIDSRLQVIRITLPSPEEQRASAGQPGSQGSAMEKALAEKKPVEIYGIYFDFNSATIKPESEAVLQQIAGILQKNPDWKLNVSGHTDNVGQDAFNQELSQRRADAVKSALMTRYQISPDRLATSGYGASRPIETNQTMEGRARNRRVELQRQ